MPTEDQANASRIRKSREIAEEIQKLDARIEDEKLTLKALKDNRDDLMQTLVDLDASPVQQEMNFGEVS